MGCRCAYDWSTRTARFQPQSASRLECRPCGTDRTLELRIRGGQRKQAQGDKKANVCQGSVRLTQKTCAAGQLTQQCTAKWFHTVPCRSRRACATVHCHRERGDKRQRI